MTSTTYCEKIEEIFDAMIRLAHEVLPENRSNVYYYVGETWSCVTAFAQSIKRETGTEELRAKFEPHVAAEEARLRRAFEDLNYRIDDPTTLRVIAGEGRIEMVNEPVYDAYSHDPDKSPHLDSFTHVLPRDEEGPRENKSRQEACSF
jgi:hypothetical protein